MVTHLFQAAFREGVYVLHRGLFRRRLGCGRSLSFDDGQGLANRFTAKVFVRAIAERGIAGLLTLTKVGLPVLFGSKGQRFQTGFAVRPVTKRLIA
jgi:hypothetical protein